MSEGMYRHTFVVDGGMMKNRSLRVEKGRQIEGNEYLCVQRYHQQQEMDVRVNLLSDEQSNYFSWPKCVHTANEIKQRMQRRRATLRREDTPGNAQRDNQTHPYVPDV